MTGGRLGPRRRERQHWSSTGEGSRSAAPVAKLPPSGFVHASCAAPTGRAGLLRGTATSSDRISAGFGGFWDDCRSAHGCWVSETLETLQLQAVSYQRDGEKVFVSASVSPLSAPFNCPWRLVSGRDTPKPRVAWRCGHPWPGSLPSLHPECQGNVIRSLHVTWD